MDIDTQKRLLEIAENHERDRKRKNTATVAATLFVLAPIFIIILFIALAVLLG